VRVVEHAEVEQLEFGHDTAFGHGVGQSANHRRLVHRRVLRKVQRPERQRRQVGTQVVVESERVRPFLERAVQPSARRHADDDVWREGADASDDVGVDRAGHGRLARQVARVQMQVAATGGDAGGGIEGNFVRLLGYRRVLAPARHHAGQCRVDDQGARVVGEVSHSSERANIG